MTLPTSSSEAASRFTARWNSVLPSFRLIFASNHINPRSRNFDLYLVNLDGTGLKQVTTHPDFDGFPMFSPDGTKLVFASNRYGKVPGETNIFLADWKEPK